MEISLMLKNLRIEHGLTQKELASMLKIGQATIACYENGQREPHISNLIAYADFFECSLDYLAGRTDDTGNIIVKEEKTFENRQILNSDEDELVSKYRKLKTADKQKLIGYLDGISNK